MRAFLLDRPPYAVTLLLDRWVALIVAIVFSGFFALFLSQHYAGDGVRWLPKFYGARLLLASLNSWEAWWNLGILAFMILMTGTFVGVLWKGLRGEDRVWWPWLGGVLWCLPGAMVAWCTEPPYPKLWVHPLAGFFFLLTWGLARLRQSGRWEWAPRIWVVIFLVTVVGVNLLVNLGPRRFTPSPYLGDARYLAEMIRERDLLVSESFDPVSVYFSTIFNRNDNSFSFLVTGIMLGLDNAALRDRLYRAIDASHRRGGACILLGALRSASGGMGANAGRQEGLRL